jgi:energy-coupling factor transporter transmembrane protein EcfT
VFNRLLEYFNKKYWEEMLEYLHVSVDSPIHKLHPLTKLIIVFVINLVSFFVINFYGTLCLLALIARATMECSYY